MQVKETNATVADKLSAQILFQDLAKFTPLADMKVLDAFARNGQLTIDSYSPYVPKSNITAWELGIEHTEDLLKKAETVLIGDSYSFLDSAVEAGLKYDMVVIDTPQGLHKDAKGFVHTEHFDFLAKSLELLSDNAVIVLYVNKAPYNKEDVGSHGYDEYTEYDFQAWMNKRIDYYGSVNITEDQALGRYRRLLQHWGFKMTQVILTPCFSDVPGRLPYSFRLALSVKRV